VPEGTDAFGSERRRSRALTLGFVTTLAVVLATIYVPDAGHGFIKDDVVWVATSRTETLGDVGDLLISKTGWFRPLVSASFALDYRLFGLEPRGYGLTNVLLIFACVAAIWCLLRALEVGKPVAIAGAFVWAFNFHGINMAALWLSGRTAPMLSLWWTIAVTLFTVKARALSVAATIMATMSKEEGFILPALLSAWTWIDSAGAGHYPRRVRWALRATWPHWLAAAGMLVLRVRSGAMTPFAAPDYYTYRFNAETLWINLAHYADRSATAATIAISVAWFALGRPRWRAFDVSRVKKGLVWIAISLVPTILIPTRSSLYALLPSIGVIIVFTAAVDAWLARTSAVVHRRTAVAMMIVLLLLWPIYKSRNVRYVGEARLSAAVLRHVRDIDASHARGLVILKDVRNGRPTAEQAFGTLANEASTLVTDGRIGLWIDPPPGDFVSGGFVTPPSAPIVGELVAERGVVTRIR
jgi:hypothetical protein